MGKLTDEQIMLLEQLTYLNDRIAGDAGVSIGHEGDTIGEFLSEFSEEVLDELAKIDKPGTTEEYNETISGSEWAAIIRAVQEDEELCSYKITDIDDKVYAICVEDPDNPDSAIVAFRGTTGEDEWKDNAHGLFQSDTECQEQALEYIESLPYDSIVVTGHSKGGNKAQYVTILSDKVVDCVSMDGQGFSQEFLEQYFAEIQEKGHLIRNYYLDGDYVNILMFPIPNAQQICVEGEDSVVHMYYHNPSSFFQYYQDEDGHWRIELNEDGSAYLKPGERYAVTQYLQELTYFILNVAPIEDRERLGVYIGNLLALALVPGAHVQDGNTVYTSENLMDYIFSDEDALSLTIAYVLKYVETYNLTADEIMSILEFLGIDDYLEENPIDISDLLPLVPGLAIATGPAGVLTVDFLADLIIQLSEEFHDGKRDPILEGILKIISNLFGFNFSMDELWAKTEKAYSEIPEYDASAANTARVCPANVIRDFSQETYNMIMETIEAINSNISGTVEGWSAFADEDWYNSLGIANFIRGISKHAQNTVEVNTDCKTKIERVFEAARNIDMQNAAEASLISDNLRSLTTSVLSLADNLG